MLATLPPGLLGSIPEWVWGLFWLFLFVFLTLAADFVFLSVTGPSFPKLAILNLAIVGFALAFLRMLNFPFSLAFVFTGIVGAITAAMIARIIVRRR